MTGERIPELERVGQTSRTSIGGNQKGKRGKDMKTFKKVLASALAAAMVVTAFPVANAEAASTAKLSATKATLYVGQSKTLKVTTPKTWKSVKVTAASSKKSVASVKKSGKKVTVKAVKAGTAKVTVKVTAKKGKKSVKKTLTFKATVKNPTLTVKAAATELAVGETTTITAKATPKKTVSFKSSDETIATVDATTGAVKAVKAGTVKITATAGKLSKDVDLTIKNVIFKSVAQASTTTLAATFAGNTKALKATDFKITNTFNNVVYAVKDVTVDAKDATKVTLTTYMEMKDAKEYTVEYDGTTQKFTATDGVAVTLGLDKTTIDAATETEIQAQAKDANGIVVGTYKYGDAKVTMTVNVTNGYMTGTKLYLNKAGDTASVDLTYHKGTFDTTGKEEVIEQKGITVTAVDPEKVTVAGWAVKIGDAGKTFDKVTETKIAAGDTKTAYVQITNSKNEKSVDISKYSVESSNNDAMFVGTVVKTAGTVELIAVKEGTNYIIVKDDKGAVVTTLPITIVAERKATSIEVDKPNVTVSKSISEKATVKVAVKDQYGEKFATISNPSIKTLSFTDAATSTTTTANMDFDTVAVSTTSGAFDIEANTASADGTFVLKVTASGLSRTMNVKVVTANSAAKTSYAFDLSANTADAVITKDADHDTALTAHVYELKGGVKNRELDDSQITAKLTNAKGEVVNTVVTTGATVTSNGITIPVNDRSTGKKLGAGTYTLTVAPKTGNVIPTFTRTIVITDSQTKVSVKRVSTSGASVFACFEFYLEGEKLSLTSGDVKFFKGTTEVTNTTAGNKTPVTTAEVTYTYGSNKVVQTVAVGLTVEVK